MKQYRKLLVAPVNLRNRLEALIKREIEHARNNRPAYIIIKVNSIVDAEMTKCLYEASQAGVRIDLLVRGMCCLIPAKEGLSENIRVFSAVGRFLEHSRIFYFQNDGQEEIYLGSADLMTRNLSRRVETLFPIEDERYIRYLRDEVLETYLKDNVNSREMLPDGNYRRVVPEKGQPRVDVQGWLIAHPHGDTYLQ
jgi:polyphosphate kinase